MTFARSNNIQGIGYLYTAASGLRPGRYKVVSTAIGDLYGYDGVVGYVIRHKGKLRRLMLS